MDGPVVESLETPLFLVAMPQVGDPFFFRSVVLLLEHGEQGSFGLVANRITELPVSAIVAELGMEWRGRNEPFAYFGGPVHPNVGTAMFSAAVVSEADERATEFAPGIWLSQDVRVLSELSAAPPTRFRLILGSAGWTAGQLETELARNDWLIAPFSADLLFWDSSTKVWERALESIGVRPESLPAWLGSDEGGAN